MRRRQPPPPPAVPEGKMYWPGVNDPGVDPVVPIGMVEAECRKHCAPFDHLGARHPDHWRNDPTYELRKKGRRKR